MSREKDRQREKGGYLRFRRAVESIVVLLLLPLCLPLCALIALAIRLDSGGPILFRQERAGRGDSTFTILKFRTMTEVGGEAAEHLTQQNDRRITSVGRILRTSHLDELPQLWNVLRGEMALIGPRPEPLWHVEECERRYPDYHLRRAVTPGLTGLAQVELDYVDSVERAPEKLRYDLDYIEQLSPRLDLIILLRTLRGRRGR